MVKVRVPPGGSDHVASLLHGATRPDSRGPDFKSRYAEDLRVQMAEQRARRQDEDNERMQRDRSRSRSRSDDGRASPRHAAAHGFPSYSPAAGPADPDYYRSGRPHEAPPLPAPQPAYPYQTYQAYPAPGGAVDPQYRQQLGGGAELGGMGYPPAAMPPQRYGQPLQPAPYVQPLDMAYPLYSPWPPPSYGRVPDRGPGNEAYSPAMPRHGVTFADNDQNHRLNGQVAWTGSPAAQRASDGVATRDSALAKKAAYKAELEAQIAAQQDSKRRQKEQDMQEDLLRISAARQAPAHRGGGGAPLRDMHGAVITNRSAAVDYASGGAYSPQGSWVPGHAHQNVGYNDSPARQFGDSLSPSHGFGQAAPQRGPDEFQAQFHTPPYPAHNASSSPTGYPAPNSHPELPSFIKLGQGGAHVPRGLANHESALATAPTLNFKSDKAYLTREEIQHKAQAASELQEFLARQVEQKKRQKEEEKQREAEREQREVERLRREQAEMSAKQQDELRKERGPVVGQVGAEDPVAEAWRKAQEEAEAAKRSNRRANAAREQSGHHFGEAPQQAGPADDATLLHDMPVPLHYPGQPPLSPLVNAKMGAVRQEVRAQLDAVRQELERERSLRMTAMERQDALDSEIAALVRRTNQTEAQSLTSRQELESLRQLMKRKEVDHAALELLSVPANGATLQLPRPFSPGNQRRHDVEGDKIAGFIQSMPQPAARQRGTTVQDRVYGRTPSEPALPDSLMLLQHNAPVEQSLTCHARFVPLDSSINMFDTPPMRGPSPRSRSARTQPAAIRHTSIPRFTSAAPHRSVGRLVAGYPGISTSPEAAATRDALDVNDQHALAVDRLEMLNQIAQRGDDSVEALDDFLTRFVNHGNSQKPLYSRASVDQSPAAVLAKGPSAAARLPSRQADTSIDGTTLGAIQETNDMATAAMTDALDALGHSPASLPRMASPPPHEAVDYRWEPDGNDHLPLPRALDAGPDVGVYDSLQSESDFSLKEHDERLRAQPESSL